MRQLYPQNGRLDRIHTAVPPECFVKVAARATVIVQAAHVLGEFGIARSHQSCIAVSAQILSWIEAEGCGNAEGSGTPATPRCSNGLGGVFNDGQLEFIGEALKSVHFGALAIEVDRQKCAYFIRSTRPKFSPDFFRIEIQRGEIQIHENRPGAGARNGAGRSKETG